MPHSNIARNHKNCIGPVSNWLRVDTRSKCDALLMNTTVGKGEAKVQKAERHLCKSG
jgi:hypothetical protein